MLSSQPQFYPYARPCLDDSDIAALVEVARSPMLTTGPRVAEFESAMASRLGHAAGPAHAAAVSSGTAALHLAAMALGLGPGDEVIVPTLTFLATPNAVRYVGAEPVLVDVDPLTLAVDVDQVERLLESRPQIRAIFVVHFAGLPAPLVRLAALAKRHGIALVDDAAHALGAEYDADGKRHEVGDGAHTDLTCLSFHAVKNIATGEGGMVVSRDVARIERVKQLRHHGLESPADEIDREGPWYRHMSELGFNYRLTDLQCALGSSQLARLDEFVARRRAIAKRYDAAFESFAELVVRQAPTGSHSSYHLYPMELAPEHVSRRRGIFERLRELQLGVTVNYLPIHRNPYYAEQARSRTYPVAESFYARSICLPMYPDLSDDDVDEVVDRVARALKR